MDFIIVLYWFLAFSVIILFLGALNYFIGSPQSHPTVSRKQSQSEKTQQQNQTNGTTTNSQRRKSSRNANKKRLKAKTLTISDNLNSNNCDNNDDEEKNQTLIFEAKINEEERLTEPSVHMTKETEEEVFEDPLDIDNVLISPHLPESFQEEKESLLSAKQRNKCKNNRINYRQQNAPSNTRNSSISPSLCKSLLSHKQEAVILSKPLANVAPVIQAAPIANNNSATEKISNPLTIDSKSNENSSLSNDIYSDLELNNLHSKFQEQDKDSEVFHLHRVRGKKGPATVSAKKVFSEPASTKKQNDVKTSMQKQQTNAKSSFELLVSENKINLGHFNGYSSESDILSESTSTVVTTNNNGSLLSTSTKSPYSLKELDMKRTLSTSSRILDELVSIFDTTSFSSDELELILKTITAKNLLNKRNCQHTLSTKTKVENSMERLLEEKYYNQAKILAIELQLEKNRVLELSKINLELESATKRLQQSNDSIAPYQQAVLSYQMQMRRLTDENASLAHQLHAYSIMPASINELRQQQHILDEQFRQIANRNSSLEKEIADGERARKQAAEIYKKGDDQKQVRIEQMQVDINKYKKIDKELSIMRQKYEELQENSIAKLNDVTNQRDQLRQTYELLKEKVKKYEELETKHEQITGEEIETSNFDQLQQELNEVKDRNELLQKRNMKILEQLNKQKQIRLSQSC